MDPNALPIQHLTPIAIEGHRSSGAGGPDHPMRIATRRAAGLDADGWTPDLRDLVEDYFDDLADEWHTRSSPERMAVVTDALSRGLGASRRAGRDRGRGWQRHRRVFKSHSGALRESYRHRSLAGDVEASPGRAGPSGPGRRRQPSGWRFVRGSHRVDQRLPVPRRSGTRAGARRYLVWVNSSGEQTPIYLSVDDLVARLPGEWTGAASRAGEGHWCVLRRV